MPKSENQKLKLLFLMKILLEKTDEDHTMSVPDMIDALSQYDISAERKSIYDDLDALQRFGVDVECKKTKTTGYYIASRAFELPELKLLADAVASSKFITEKKSSELIKKIESLTSIHQARQIGRQVYVMGRIKALNEQIYYNVDAIHQAISQNKKISFRYFEYTVDKEKRYRHDGEIYHASPYALCWDDENYYMIAYYEKYDNLSHFRVDKMEGIAMLDHVRHSNRGSAEFNPAEYSKKAFGMFGGQEERIRLYFDNSLIGVVLDRFGKEVSVQRWDENHFVVNVNAFISPTLLGWLFSFADKVKVLSPDSLVAALSDNAEKCLDMYATQK